MVLHRLPRTSRRKQTPNPYQRDFRDLLDSVSFGHDQSRDPRGRDGRAHGESFLVDVESVMPSPPGFRRREHSSAAAHVAVRRLTGSVSAATSHAGNSSDSPTSAPRRSGRLMTGFLAHLQKK